MKRLVFAFLFSLFLFPQVVFALPEEPDIPPTERYATCDQCGLCVPPDTYPPQWAELNITPPEKWESCKECLYPDAGSALSGDTLRIDPLTNRAPEVKNGRHYTIAGCFRTNLSDFAAEGGAGSVTQTLLNIIISVSGGIAFLYLLYGSFIVATSQAEPERLNYGKRVIMGSIIGLLFVLFSVFLVNLIANGILKIPGFSTE